MSNPPTPGRKWDESPSASETPIRDNQPMFQLLFERSADAMLLLDPQVGVFVDCNQAAVELMRVDSKEKLLQARPEDFSPFLQPDGTPSGKKTDEIVALVEKHGWHRFEWVGRRLDGSEVPLEVLVTQVHVEGRKLNVSVVRDITERKKTEAALRESEEKFRELFEASADAISLLDPETGKFVACNDAAVKMAAGADKNWFLSQSPVSLAPERQPDGRSSSEAAEAWIQRALAHGTQRFEWVGRRVTGEEVPMELLLTPVRHRGNVRLIVVGRDISERKQNEQELLELNQSLERRVAERTTALATSEAQFRALVEHAPEAIVVFNGDTGRFLFGNEHACILYGVPMEKLTDLTPADVSPAFQPNGRRSSELARELMDQALAGGKPVFEWVHRQPDGRLIPTEVRLLRLPAEGQNLVRASIIDNTESKRAQRAMRESEEKFRALFEGSSHGVILQDEYQFLEVNPAAVRIMGCQSPQELLGKYPTDTSPPFQPNGESSAVLARKYVQECLVNGSARFEWTSLTPEGKEVPLEVTLTRIQWSGRQVIQALLTDISERKRAQAALAESETRFSVAFQASPIFIAIARMSDGRFVLANDAFVNWSGYAREEVLGRSTAEIGVWERQEDREAFWQDLRHTGSVRQRECRFRNRSGGLFTMLLSSEIIQLNHVPHMLSMALDITGRKQMEAELRESEARLRDSETRFSAAFQASPVLTAIGRVSDGRFVLVNDAFVRWTGYSREEILGRTTVELNMWEHPNDREEHWAELRQTGSIRERECRFRDRSGRFFTILLSTEVIQLNDVPHTLSMGVDITERKRAQVELAETEARFSAAFHASPAFLGILRLSDGKYVLANEAYLNWLGYPREEVLGHSCLELGMWENPGDRDLLLNDMHALGSVRQRECRWRNRSGGLFTILLSAETIKLNDTPHMLLMALDITQRKRAEEELLNTLEREKELSQLKSNFVSMVSHEFRTPLGIIQSSAELLRDFYQKMQPDERNEQLESISRNTRRMAGMMEEILVLSRLDAGKLDFQPATLDLHGFCHRLVDEVMSATNKRCVIELSLASLPPSARADERLLAHIFTNLLSNAVKYSEPRATVCFALEQDGADLVCTVRDRGIGISDEDQQHLFAAFHRGDNVGTRPGTGLGLFLVKRCVELHQGTLHLVSKLGVGTIVTVRLPVFDENL